MARPRAIQKQRVMMNAYDPSKKAIRAIIADDEALARQLIVEYLQAFPHIDIIETCESGPKTVTAVNKHRPDLLFLDVQMPGLTGFAVLEQLNQIPSLIFSTAYDQYALRAFEVNAIDYLLKPYEAQRFNQAVARALANIQQPPLDQLANLIHAMRPADQKTSQILVKQGAKLIPLPLQSILCIEAADDYTLLRTAEGSHLSSLRLNELEKRLDSSIFIRIHRCTLLNIQHLSHLEKDGQGGMIATLTDGLQKRVSRRYASELRQWVV